MSLTVPRAGISAGRAAQPQFEAPGAAAEIERFGARMLEIGGAIQQERLNRTNTRLTVDLQNDMNALRLEAESIGDPDQLDSFWAERTTRLRQQYFEGGGDQAQARVPPALRSQFETRFDDLAGRHAYAVGARALELRNSQVEANWVEFSHTATTTTARFDPQVRAATIQQADELIDQQLASGIITPEQAALRRQGFRADFDNARAIIDIDRDPDAFLASLQGGDYEGLGAEQRSRYEVQAQNAIDQRLAAAEAARNQELAELTAVINTGLPAANAGILADPAYQGLENFPRAAATQALVSARGNIRQMTVPQIEQALAAERARPIVERWQAERVEVMEELLAEARQGWGSDPIAHAAEVGLPMPAFVQFDPANPRAFAQFLADRRAATGALGAQGYAVGDRLFSEEERIAVQAAAGLDQDPAARAQLADLLTQSGAAGIVQDPVFRHTGGLAAAGVPAALRTEILRGQQVIDQNNVVMPPLRDRVGVVHAMVEDVFADMSDGEAVQGQIVSAADALYAARVRRVDPDGDIDPDIYLQALHEVLGGTGDVRSRRGGEAVNRNRAVGGVQEWNERLTIFPRGVAADDFSAALGRLDALYGGRSAPRGQAAIAANPQDVETRLTAASVGGAPPAINGQVLTPAQLAGLEMRALGDDLYVFIRQTQAGTVMIGDTAGRPYQFSMTRFISEAAR